LGCEPKATNVMLNGKTFAITATNRVGRESDIYQDVALLAIIGSNTPAPNSV